MDIQKRYAQASVKTADNLRTIARSMVVRDLSRLSLPEIDAVVELVGRVAPAGNVPGVILNGLARLPGRKPSPRIVKRDVNLLFKGIERALDRAVYGAFFAGPAAVIWGYQNLLKLAGKQPDAAFPEGVWQFYVDYALREDTARHASENHNFDTILRQHQVRLSQADRITAWVMAAIHCLHQYDALLENEWRERVYTFILRQVTAGEPDAARYAQLYRAWSRERPYGRGADSAPNETFPEYRQARFDRFMREALLDLKDGLRREWDDRVRQAQDHDLPAYRRQLSILAYLDPGPYGETRTAIPLGKAQIGVVWQGAYYLVPACAAGSDRPADVTMVRQQVAALVAQRGREPAGLTKLATIQRAAWPRLHSRLSPGLVEALDVLRFAPILLNHDPRPRHLPLSELRQAERGRGDHALTIFDTGESFVFDQSHIFFDGAWGAALAEILTSEALSWAVYLSRLPSVQSGSDPVTLAFPFEPAGEKLIEQAPRVAAEVGVECDSVDLRALLALRKIFKQRSDLLRLTVNDLLVLYRAIHAVSYRPAAELMVEIESLAGQGERTAAAAALVVTSQEASPAILIPVDASPRSPRDRLYPMTLDVPLAELDLIELHRRAMMVLDRYKSGTGDQNIAYAEFDALQRVYLATLAGFGEVMGRAKELALTGESVSVGAIKLLAHMPAPLQRLLDQIPSRFDILNDIIKGREVFSNVGAVAKGSALVRFITAKDDNEKKTLAWGVLTDAKGVMHISLRDFRPHVGRLAAMGRRDLAVRMAQDYLNDYAQGLNGYVRDLRRITAAGRKV